MTLFDDRDDRTKVESIVFNERQATRRSRTSWIPGARTPSGPPSSSAMPKPAAVPVIEETAPATVPAAVQSDVHLAERAAATALAQDLAAKAAEATAKSESARVRAETAADAFEAAVRDVAELRSTVLAETEREVVQLALAIARRVLQREASTNSAVVAELARQGIAILAESDRVLVRVGPDVDESHMEALARDLSRKGVKLEVHKDASLPTHACVVETEFGRIDESLDARLSRIESVLLPPKAHG